MKKLLLPLLTLFIANNSVTAQTSEFNKWSVELNGGANKALHNWGEGYSAPYNFLHADAGVRFMINSKFGLKASFGYDNLKNGDSSKSFKTDIYRYNLEGVINVGRVLSFEEWTNTIGILLHAGAGYTTFNFGNFPDRNDDAVNIMVGLTPQIRLSNRIALTLDVTAINNFKQKYTWDGSVRPNDDLKASGTVEVDGEKGSVNISVPDPSKKFLKHLNPILNTSVGVTFYLGNKPTHADWYVNKKDNTEIVEMQNELEEIQNKYNALEEKLRDSDNDGTPDYLDNCISVPGPIENRGCPWPDRDNDGTPDHLDECPDVAGPKSNHGCPVMEKKDVDQMNSYAKTILFNTNQSTFQSQSFLVLDNIVKKMKEFPNSKFDINGYTDTTGNNKINLPLSDARANAVKDYLIKNGIKADRLTAKGFGSADPIDSNKTAEGRANNRRTEIVLKK